MFSGIVEEIGIVQSVIKRKNLSTLKIKASKVLRGIKKSDSLAVDGVCLTVTDIRLKVLSFDIMRETIDATTLGMVKARDKVNLERALKFNDRISGHFVSGHIDGISKITDKIIDKNYTELRIPFVRGTKKYIVPKGSICIDGISLTVGAVRKNDFSVYLIPFTKEVTTLDKKRKGSKLNIEADILAKYVQQRSVI